MKTRALVIVFTGEPTDEITRGAIAAILRRSGASQADMIELDLKEIAQSIITATVSPKSEELSSHVMNHTPEDEAVIVVGTIMKEELSHFNATSFVAALSQRINEASINPNQEDNKAFMNALFILSKEDLVISQSLLKKYKLNQQKIALIKRVYNLASSF